MTDQPAPACSWYTLRQPHGPHDWWPDTGGTIHCPGWQPAGHDGPSIAECAADDRRWWDSEREGE